jgi:23S rRNA pseudouridine2605 synthase
MMEPVRLQKYLARSGVASRRASEGIITAGRVSVNGHVVRELGTKVIPGVDVVKLDGEALSLPSERVVIMLDKPAGILSAMSDSHGAHCVSELIPTDTYAGLFPVGRLDKDTTGLLLFTNDGELGNALIHPRHHIPKTYLVQVAGTLEDSALERLRGGVMLEDGITQPAEVEVREQDRRTTLLEITIYEGRNRQVRRMCAAVGHPVKTLRRVAMGPLLLSGLEQGQWRLLSEREQGALLAATGLSHDRMVEQRDA